MPNGIDLIIADHEAVAELFSAFEASPQGATVGRIIDALEAHDDAEHAALYPLAAQLLGDAAPVPQAELAHAVIKRQIEVASAQEGGPLVDAMAELRRLVEDHVADEERALLPALAQQASAAQLEELGARLLQAKQRVG